MPKNIWMTISKALYVPGTYMNVWGQKKVLTGTLDELITFTGQSRKS